MRVLLGLVLAAALVAAAGLWITRPKALSEGEWTLTGDAAAGERIFNLAGCAGCHAAEGATGEDRLILAGGQKLVSPFGTFSVPNISTSEAHGIGGWTDAELATAIMLGTSPEGAHLYPAFPYAEYGLAQRQDVADLIAYLRTLPASEAPSEPHGLKFPYSIRAGVGVWKLINLPDGFTGIGPEDGRYIVEALSHCAECHTPRDWTGGLDRARWMAGAPNPSGKGNIPNITPAGLKWSEEDVAYYLETGFTPEFDSAGGHMAEVVASLSQVRPEDRAAIAAYVKALAPAE